MPVVPDPPPKTIGQWAALGKDVRAITPMPRHRKPRIVDEEVEMRCWKMFRELRYLEQRRIIEVVERSWREGDEVRSLLPFLFNFFSIFVMYLDTESCRIVLSDITSRYRKVV